MDIKKKKPDVPENLLFYTKKDRAEFLKKYFRETHSVAVKILNAPDVLDGAVSCADAVVKRICEMRDNGTIMSDVAHALLVNENSRLVEGMDMQPDKVLDETIDGFAQYFPVGTTENIWRKWLKHILWDEVIGCMARSREKDAAWYADSVSFLVESFIECRGRFRKWWKNKR